MKIDNIPVINVNDCATKFKFDNEIDGADLEGLEGMVIGVLPVRPDAIVLNSERFVSDIFSFESLNVRLSSFSFFQWWWGRESGRLRINQNIGKREPKRKLISPEAMSCRITSSCTLLKRITRSRMKV